MGTLTITAGSLAAYTVAVEQGNLALSGLTAAQREAILVEDRGVGCVGRDLGERSRLDAGEVLDPRRP